MTGACAQRSTRAGSSRAGLPNVPFFYGIIVWLKKTLHIDDELFREAKAVSGAATDTETVRLGLEALVRRAAYQRLRALLGTEPGASDVPRRRESQSGKRRAG